MLYPLGRPALRAVAAACLLVASTHPAIAAVPPGAAAEIVNLQGNGEQKPAAAPDWRPARVAQPLATGDYVRTRESARMALLFADETQIRLNQNTVLQVKAVAAPGQPATTLSLESGRAWAQTRRPPGVPLNLQTPAATAGIRGTDWDIEVGPDGRTQLTVFSGEVSLANPQGEVIVGRNEAAIAEVGKAPVKIQLTQPRDRIQWVNALRHEPERFRGLEPAIAEIASRADRQLVDGESAQAIATLQGGLARFPNHPVLRAELARAQLFADRVDDAARTLADIRPEDPAPLWIARGALARRQGEAPATLAAYATAIEKGPQDDRAWFGLGSAQTEREDLKPARRNLLKALELHPQGAGYQGELGTLEAFRNDPAAAEAAFQRALADNSADYVALTGLGLLRLKQGRPADALDAFLRAGVMEPRYARAKTYTGVAYWQLGRRSDAIATLRQAALLDDKDPLPHLFLAQIHTDLFQAGDAVQASRAAVERMRYLKSLNQVANDQQGRANFGASLAFFGMEDWAQELAQQSYYPYWGGSHLFLADRYPGEFNKNSELFQGFLTDPLSFGGSPRFSTLLQSPGHYATVEGMWERADYHAFLPSIALNGLSGTGVPFAYFVKAQSALATRFPIDVSVSDFPQTRDRSGTADLRVRVGTLGFGLKPTAELGLFAYFNRTGIDYNGRNRVFFLDDFAPTSLESASRQAVLGGSYRWSPTSQTWLKVGHATEDMRFARYPTQFAIPPLAAILGTAGTPEKRFSDIQLRHTTDVRPESRAWVSLEHVKEKQLNTVAGAGPIGAEVNGQLFSDTFVFIGQNNVDRRYTGLTAGWQEGLTTPLRLDGSVTANWIRHRTHGATRVGLIDIAFVQDTNADRDEMERVVAPRLGVVWQARSDLTLRAAYQHWLRPLSVSTLANVDTAGIPVEDRLLEAGGQYRRVVAQAAWTPDDRTFGALRIDHFRVRNPSSTGVDLRTPSLPFLEDVRNAQLVNLSNVDTLENSPIVDRGRLTMATAAVNRLLTREVSAYLRYTWQRSSSSYIDNATSTEVSDKRFPWIPSHTFVLGGTWATARHFYLSARAIYRSQRFEDTTNLTPVRAGWGLDLAGFWESDDKRWLVGAGALNVGGRNQDRQPRRYVIDAKLRF